MDPDSLRRSAEEDDTQIAYWRDQIGLEQQQSATRIQNFEAEIAKHEKHMQEKLDKATQLEIEAAKAKDKLEEAAAAAVTRRIL